MCKFNHKSKFILFLFLMVILAILTIGSILNVSKKSLFFKSNNVIFPTDEIINSSNLANIEYQSLDVIVQNIKEDISTIEQEELNGTDNSNDNSLVNTIINVPTKHSSTVTHSNNVQSSNNAIESESKGDNVASNSNNSSITNNQSIENNVESSNDVAKPNNDNVKTINDNLITTNNSSSSNTNILGISPTVQVTNNFTGFSMASILYKYLPIDNYYVAENGCSLPGNAILSLRLGDSVQIESESYIASNVISNIPYKESHSIIFNNLNGRAALQTCELPGEYTLLRLVVLS